MVMESGEFDERKGANPAYIDENKNEAYTSAVAISHIEGDCDIEEILMFRIEANVFPQIDDTDIFMEVDMIFHENDPENPIFEKKSVKNKIILATHKPLRRKTRTFWAQGGTS